MALAGAVDELARAGHSFVRIAGNSGGAFLGAVVAALEASGTPVAGNIADLARAIPFETFTAVRSRRLLKPLLEATSLVRRAGLHDGVALRDWLAGTLARYGVRTFADLRLPAGYRDGLPAGHQYRFVATASDISTATPVKWPWDASRYGMAADTLAVADVVRMSVAVPFFFTPVRFRAGDGNVHTMVDGCVFTNYPATLLDRPDGGRPPRQVIGVNLAGILPHDDRRVHHVRGPLSLGHCLATSVVGACDATVLDEPRHVGRTISIPVSRCGVNPLNFHLKDRQKDRLLEAGREAAAEFLSSWDFDGYCERHHPQAPASASAPVLRAAV